MKGSMGVKGFSWNHQCLVAESSVIVQCFLFLLFS